MIPACGPGEARRLPCKVICPLIPASQYTFMAIGRMFPAAGGFLPQPALGWISDLDAVRTHPSNKQRAPIYKGHARTWHTLPGRSEATMKRFWKIAYPLVVAGLVIGAVAQKAFREYPSVEYGDVQLPPDWKRARRVDLRPPRCTPRGPSTAIAAASTGRGRRAFSLDPGLSRAPTAPLPTRSGDLTRVDSRSVEQPVNLDDGDESTTGPGFTPCRWANGV